MLLLSHWVSHSVSTEQKGFSAGRFYCLFMAFVPGTPVVGFLLGRRAEVLIWSRCKSIFPKSLKRSMGSDPEHWEVALYHSESFKGWWSRWVYPLTRGVSGVFKRGKSQGLRSSWLLEQMCFVGKPFLASSITWKPARSFSDACASSPTWAGLELTYDDSRAAGACW